MILLECEQLSQFPEEDTFQNALIGIQTASFGRLHLLDLLEKAGEHCIYCDTDSVVFSHDSTKPLPFTEGYLLGDVVSELKPGTHITEFVSSGPKSYAYSCSDNTNVVKLKGITRNFINCQHIDIDVMKSAVFGHTASVSLPPQTQICRDKVKAVIFNRQQRKTYQKVFDKRVVVSDSYNTIPYGF